MSALETRRGLDALHLLTHGTPGRIFLGSDTLDLVSLDAQRPLLEALRHDLGKEGEWLIYGCEVGMGMAGSSLARRTAASRLLEDFLRRA
jgi:hypothetical protein